MTGQSRVAAAAALLCLLLTSCASGHREPYSGTEPLVRDPEIVQAELARLVASAPGLELVRAGLVEYGEFRAPFWLLRYRPEDARCRVLVTGGVHGNEPAGTAWLVALAELLAREPERFAGAAFDLVPLVNPWGFSRNLRHNRDGRDINRDFASFRTQEARFLRGLLSGQRYDLVVDHHEDGQARGFYLYQYAKRDTALSRRVIEGIRALGYPIEQEVRMVILRTRDGLIDAPRWGLLYMRLTRQLSLTNHIRLEHSGDVYTVETPTALPFSDRVGLHRRSFELILDGHLEAGK